MGNANYVKYYARAKNAQPIGLDNLCIVSGQVTNLPQGEAFYYTGVGLCAEDDVPDSE